jgi:hypothetical protein
VVANNLDHIGFGPSDESTLFAIREVFNRHKPLIESMRFDSDLDPQKLHVSLSDGFEESGRFDIRWSVTDNYAFHYSESGLDFRFDKHPNPHSPLTHFHSPSDSSTVAEPSCIEVELAELVSLAVIQCWRRAWENDDLSRLNTAENPP